MSDFKKLNNAIIKALTKANETSPEHLDVSDIGNEIGIIVGKYYNNMPIKLEGFEPNDFIIGASHGISLTDGTHG